MLQLLLFRKFFQELYQVDAFSTFSSALWREIQQFSLVAAYEKENEKFAISAHSPAALAFVPELDVENAFDELITHEDFDHRVQPIADYFEYTWIGRPACRGS